MYWVVMQKTMCLADDGKLWLAFERGDCIKEHSTCRLTFSSDAPLVRPLDDSLAVANPDQYRLVIAESWRHHGLLAFPRSSLSRSSFTTIENLYVLANARSLDQPDLDQLSMYNVQCREHDSRGYLNVSLVELSHQTGISVKILARHAENMVFLFQHDVWCEADVG